MVNFEFPNEIIKEDFSLNYCYQCGTYSSSCPVAFITSGEYNPRKIIERDDHVSITEAFIQGIDGLLVLGCHLGDCYYISGNYEAELKIKMLHKL
ncbi:MAG: hydrogenase iron-sulfur subunit [Promethearchaeota archaeon]